MTRHEIATLACKILALWAFMQAAFVGPTIVYMVIVGMGSAFNARGFHWGDLSAAGITGIPAIVWLLIGLFLWYRASAIAAKMMPPDLTPVTRPDFNQESVLSLALVVVGVATLIPILRDLVSSFIPIGRGRYSFLDGWASPAWQARFWSMLLGIALSVFLIFKPRGFARLILMLRRPDVADGGGPTPP